jgi:hypothetical protein
MPNYSSLSTQIEGIKSEITASLAASVYSAQDLVYVAKALQALGSVVAPDDVDEITVLNNIYLGSAAAAFADTAALTNPTLVIKKTENAYVQAAITNGSSGASASADFLAYANNGNDETGWIDMGITSSGFNDPSFTITGPNDGYIFMSAPTGTTGSGNLILATDSTGTDNKIIFAAGGLSSNNEQMSITPDQNVHIEIATPSTSPSTGALTVVGGVGITGDVNIAGNITFGGEGSSLQTSTLAVSDPLIFVGSGNTTDAVDLGLVAEYATAVSPSTKSITNKALTSNIATLTAAAHGYAVGDIAVITGVDSTFNGTYVITAVATNTFSYAKEATNVASTAVSPAGSVTVSAKRRFAAVIRDASDAVVKFVQDATTKPTSTLNISESGVTYADIQVDDITADAITANSISLTSASIGNVDNTEIQYLDGVTSSIQTQLNTKLASSTAASTYETISNVALKANIASPTFTGTPAAPTAAVDTNTTQIATTAYVIGQGYLKSATASSTYAPLTGASLVRPVLTTAFETNSVSATAATGTVNVDLSTAAVHYYTANAAANWTFNFRGNSSTTLNSILSVGQSATVAFLNTNGSTAYYPNAFQVDGVSVTPKWQGGTAPTAGNASSIDSYTFTIIKTASATYTVLASQVKFA